MGYGAHYYIYILKQYCFISFRSASVSVRFYGIKSTELPNLGLKIVFHGLYSLRSMISFLPVMIPKLISKPGTDSTMDASVNPVRVTTPASIPDDRGVILWYIIP